MASSCDHVDHVRTQLPYALLGATAAVLIGYLPAAALGVPAGVLLLLGLAVLTGWILLVGRSVDFAP
jgi:Na+/H+ antiporter NhaC